MINRYCSGNIRGVCSRNGAVRQGRESAADKPEAIVCFKNICYSDVKMQLDGSIINIFFIFVKIYV